MVTLKQIVEQLLGPDNAVGQRILAEARKYERDMWHRCSHGEWVFCPRHRDPTNLPRRLHGIEVG